jgi:hypothetical protein
MVSVKHNVIFPAACVATGEGLQSRVVAALHLPFVVHARDFYGNEITDGGWGDKIEARVTSSNEVGKRIFSHGEDFGNGTYAMQYTATLSGTYIVDVSLSSAHISGSPFTVRVEPDVVHPHSTVVEGDGVVGGLAGFRLTFVITARDSYGNTAHVAPAVIQALLDDDTRIEPHAIAENSESQTARPLSFAYVAARAGQKRVSVTLAGVHVSGSPFAVMIVSDAGAALAEKSSAVVANGLVWAGSQGRIEVVLKDALGIRLRHGGATIRAEWQR